VNRQKKQTKREHDKKRKTSLFRRISSKRANAEMQQVRSHLLNGCRAYNLIYISTLTIVLCWHKLTHHTIGKKSVTVGFFVSQQLLPVGS